MQELFPRLPGSGSTVQNLMCSAHLRHLIALLVLVLVANHARAQTGMPQQQPSHSGYCYPVRHQAGIQVFVARPKCEGSDVGILLPRLQLSLQRLQGVQGNVSVQLGGCSHPGPLAVSAYSFVVRLTACKASVADVVMGKQRLSCADIAQCQPLLCNDIVEPGKQVKITAVTKMASAPAPITLPIQKAAGITVPVSWEQMVSGSFISMADYSSQEAAGIFKATAWLLQGMDITGPMDDYVSIAITGEDKQSLDFGIVVDPLPMGAAKTRLEVYLSYATGWNVTVPVLLRVAQAGKPVDLKENLVFQLKPATWTAVIDVRKYVEGGSRPNVRIESFTKAQFGTLELLSDNVTLLYKLNVDPKQLAVTRQRLWDQFTYTVRVLPGSVTPLDSLTEPFLFRGVATVDYILPQPNPTGLSTTSFATAGSDPCPKQLPSDSPDLPVQAYASFFYAHYQTGLLTILAAEEVKLTSDKSNTAAYFVPPCLSLVVYADTVVLDGTLRIIGPRTVRLFARQVLCSGAGQCTIDTSGYDGLSYPGQQALPGVRGEAFGSDTRGNGIDGSPGGAGAPGLDGQPGGHGGDVTALIGDMGTRVNVASTGGGGGVSANVVFNLTGGRGGVGQVGGNGGKGGDGTTLNEAQCKSYWCKLREDKPFDQNGPEIAGYYEDYIWFSGITYYNYWGYGCHTGNAGKGGDAGNNGQNGAGGNGGQVTLATSVPAPVVKHLQARTPEPWQQSLAEVVGSTLKSPNGGSGGLATQSIGSKGKGGGTTNGCWVTEGLWAKRGSGLYYTTRCDYITRLQPGDNRFPQYNGVNNPSDCKVNPGNDGRDGTKSDSGPGGQSTAYTYNGIDQTPACDAEQQSLDGSGCPLLSSTSAQAFQQAANLDQLNMMLNKGTLAFQSSNSQSMTKAATLTKWIFEVAPCPATGSANDPGCVLKQQALSISEYAASGMASRGSSMVLTPRSSLQLIQSYMCLQLLPNFADMEQLYNTYYDQSADPKDRQQALESSLEEYKSFQADLKSQQQQLEESIDSTQGVVDNLFVERQAAFLALQAAEYVFQTAINKLEEEKAHWKTFGSLVSVISTAFSIVPGAMIPLTLLKQGFSGAITPLERSLFLVEGGASAAEFLKTMGHYVKPSQPVPDKITDFTKVAVGTDTWNELVQPYLDLDIADNYKALLSKYTGICDAYNKAALQLQGYYLQRDQIAAEDTAATQMLQNATIELAKTQQPNSPALLGAMRSAYTSMQKRVLDALYQEALALQYLTLASELKYQAPERLDYAGLRATNDRINQQIFDYLTQGVLEQQSTMEITITETEVPGILAAILFGEQFSVYLPADSDLSGIMAQAVAERVEAVIVGAVPVTPGDTTAKSTVRLIHTGHAEFLDTYGELHVFRSQALDPVSANTYVATGQAEKTTGNLRSLNKGAFGGDCKQLTVSDDNNLLLPVSPFTVWMIDVPQQRVNKKVDLSQATGLVLKFYMRYRTQLPRAATTDLGGLPGSKRMHSIWQSRVKFT